MGVDASGSSPERAAAELELIKARTAAVISDSAARHARARANVAATLARTAAETSMAAAASRAFTLRVSLALGAVTALALAVDVFVHESPFFIRHRMLRILHAFRFPPTVPLSRVQRLPVPQAPLALGFLPTMLLGPSGCGKSTMLAELARAAVSAPVPAPVVVLVRLRLPSNEREGSSTSATAKVLVDSDCRAA